MSQFLTHVYGQEKLKRELKLLMENHRLPHTMIFYGDDGLGKTTAAFDFADFLTGASEKIWVEIKKIKSSKNEKLLENLKGDRVWYIRPMGMELKIDQFRAFMEEMASFDEKLRVCIIDDAQKMNQYAANSFLKTLEEPVENLYFILVTSDINALLPTIVSRGERFPFFPLMENEFYYLVETVPPRFDINCKTKKRIYERHCIRPSIFYRSGYRNYIRHIGRQFHDDRQISISFYGSRHFCRHMGIRTKSNPSTFYIRTGNIDFKSIYAFHRPVSYTHLTLPTN